MLSTREKYESVFMALNYNDNDYNWASDIDDYIYYLKRAIDRRSNYVYDYKNNELIIGNGSYMLSRFEGKALLKIVIYFKKGTYDLANRKYMTCTFKYRKHRFAPITTIDQNYYGN